MQFVNCTPHVIRLNSGEEFPPSGNIARVTAYYEVIAAGLFRVKYGEVQGLPDPKPGTRYIVSAMVAGATDRGDVVVPATGHPECIRKEGQVYSVPGFIVK